jgi:hypothetical protein
MRNIEVVNQLSRESDLYQLGPREAARDATRDAVGGLGVGCLLMPDDMPVFASRGAARSAGDVISRCTK